MVASVLLVMVLDSELRVRQQGKAYVINYNGTKLIMHVCSEFLPIVANGNRKYVSVDVKKIHYNIIFMAATAVTFFTLSKRVEKNKLKGGKKVAMC